MPKKVLIVDDDKSVRELYLLFFATYGFDAVGAENGQEGLAVLTKEKIDLVVLDLAMPVMAGEELMEGMLANPALAKIPIIVETAIHPVTDRLTGIQKRFGGRLRYAFLERPSSLEQIAKVVQELLPRASWKK